MTDQEILEKYKESIDQSITHYLQDLACSDKRDEIKFIHNYKYHFVKGYREGRAEEKIAITKNLLKLGLSIELIADSTGLSKEEIENIK